MFRTAILDVSERCGRRCIDRNPNPRSGFVFQLVTNTHVNQLRLKSHKRSNLNSNSWIRSQKRPAAFAPPRAGNRAPLSRVVICGNANKQTLLCQRLLVAVVELELPWFLWKVTLWAHMISDVSTVETSRICNLDSLRGFCSVGHMSRILVYVKGFFFKKKFKVFCYCVLRANAYLCFH